MYLNKYSFQINYFIPNINTNTLSIFKSKMLTNCLTICPVSYKDNPSDYPVLQYIIIMYYNLIKTCQMLDEVLDLPTVCKSL